MSILDTLITDRTQADVNRIKQIMTKGLPRMTADEKLYFLKGQLEAMQDSTADTLIDSNGLTIGCRDGVLPKGSYNYTDLNRVIDAVEYLTGVIRSAGYVIDDPDNIAIVRTWASDDNISENRIKNPTFTNGTSLDKWTQYNSAYFSVTPDKNDEMDFVAIEKITAISTVATYDVLMTNFSQGSRRNGGVYYFGLRYLSSSSNNGAIRLRLWKQTESGNKSEYIDLPDVRDEIQEFHILTDNLYALTICIENTATAKGSIYYVSRPFVYNLTDAYGAGREPSLEWCVNHLGHSGLLKLGGSFTVRDIPTQEQMTTYLANVQRVIDRLPLVNVRYDTIPTLPADMDGLLPAEANNIEKVLPLVADTIERILTERLSYYSGDLYGGEV